MNPSGQEASPGGRMVRGSPQVALKSKDKHSNATLGQLCAVPLSQYPHNNKIKHKMKMFKINKLKLTTLLTITHRGAAGRIDHTGTRRAL